MAPLILPCLPAWPGGQCKAPTWVAPAGPAEPAALPLPCVAALPQAVLLTINPPAPATHRPCLLQEDLWRQVLASQLAQFRRITAPLQLAPAAGRGRLVAAVPLRVYLRRDGGGAPTREAAGQAWWGRLQAVLCCPAALRCCCCVAALLLCCAVLCCAVLRCCCAVLCNAEPAASRGVVSWATSLLHARPLLMTPLTPLLMQAGYLSSYEDIDYTSRPAPAQAADGSPVSLRQALLALLEECLAEAAATAAPAAPPAAASTAVLAASAAAPPRAGDEAAAAAGEGGADGGEAEAAEEGAAPSAEPSVQASSTSLDGGSAAAAAAAGPATEPAAAEAPAAGGSLAAGSAAAGKLLDRVAAAHGVLVGGAAPPLAAPLAWLHTQLAAADHFLYVVLHLLASENPEQRQQRQEGRPLLSNDPLPLQARICVPNQPSPAGGAGGPLAQGKLVAVGSGSDSTLGPMGRVMQAAAGGAAPRPAPAPPAPCTPRPCPRRPAWVGRLVGVKSAGLSHKAID